MAWVPNSRFEDDLVDMEPDFNLIHGQLAYEAKKKQEFCPRPKATYEYLTAREKRNSEQEKDNGRCQLLLGVQHANESNFLHVFAFAFVCVPLYVCLFAWNNSNATVCTLHKY